MNALWILVLIGIFSIAIGVKLFLDSVPEGYEDDQGFHFGKRPQG